MVVPVILHRYHSVDQCAGDKLKILFSVAPPQERSELSGHYSVCVLVRLHGCLLVATDPPPLPCTFPAIPPTQNKRTPDLA